MKYDREKQYTWDPEEMFQLSGRELGLISYTMKSILSTETAAQILLAERVNSVVEKIIAKGVEDGLMTEIPQENGKENEASQES